jgi:hypothetical protein
MCHLLHAVAGPGALGIPGRDPESADFFHLEAGRGRASSLQILPAYFQDRVYPSSPSSSTPGAARCCAHHLRASPVLPGAAPTIFEQSPSTEVSPGVLLHATTPSWARSLPARDSRPGRAGAYQIGRSFTGATFSTCHRTCFFFVQLYELSSTILSVPPPPPPCNEAGNPPDSL